MNAAAHGGKAAQLGTMAPWPFHSLVIQRGEQSVWAVVDLRKGHTAYVGAAGLDSCVNEQAGEHITQLCYDLHELWDAGRLDKDSDYAAWYVDSCVGGMPGEVRL